MCQPAEQAPDRAPVDLHLFIGQDASPEVAEATAEAARAVWQRLGLPVRLQATTHLDAPSPTRLFDPEAPSASGKLAPLQALVRGVSPVRSGVPIVVLARFEDTPTALSSLRGLTVPGRGSPLEHAPEHAIFSAIERPDHPVVFLNAGAGPRAPGDLSLAPAHELGHALGLPHRRETSALMSSGPLNLRCIPGLSAEEWAVVAGSR